MYRTPVLLLCLLSVTASAGDANSLTGTDSTSSDDLIPCEKSDDCKELEGPHICSNGTCYGCYECCAFKKPHCPWRRCPCTWFLTDEELKIVAQAVLGVAVFVTCVALLSLLWKICARRLRRRRRGRRLEAGADVPDDAASLSSQQVFVVERLRDRPPRYEEAGRDFAVEKPPPYSEVVVEEVQWARIGGLTARDFAAPPPYSPPPQRAAPAAAPTASLAPPPQPQPPPPPPTPPVQRLRRCVRKVVVIGRLVRRSSAEPEADCGTHLPKGLPPPTTPGLSTAATSAASEPEPQAAASAAQEPGSPTSTAA
ncbi:translation initiation factor IF-2-like isoform X2 [Schistocerca gregaria]|uniref:translation initiation factor IF-2-like isoform X1 n=1 Tax=Schistocerca gregaria TaxID=7010 RepID=UPI00211DAE5B|nr:translation initiation factor IF-2-like isoform X1 [Schistocerca gregaria]XP_049842798.1 translation initiation factor IF-2-like isoform X2 [Schistocerca gregaria]